ncbi:MAG TPA: hypothetical protein DCY20_03555 [Firmicutes bacterium]|nr:hypothetical protein [Bacillota bacterium]
MRRLLPTITFVVVTALLLVFALTYDIPEIKVFKFFQDVDQKIITCEDQNKETLETTLEQLQFSVKELINIGQTYDGQTNVTTQFEEYETNYDAVKKYTESVSVCISKVIEETNFDKVEKKTKKLSPELLALANNMVELQQERTTKLADLKTKLDALVNALESFEEMFYNTKTSDSVQYFESVNVAFQEVQALHTDYMDTVQAYYQAKEMYYEQIANKTIIDYLFR